MTDTWIFTLLTCLIGTQISSDDTEISLPVHLRIGLDGRLGQGRPSDGTHGLQTFSPDAESQSFDDNPVINSEGSFPDNQQLDLDLAPDEYNRQIPAMYRPSRLLGATTVTLPSKESSLDERLSAKEYDIADEDPTDWGDASDDNDHDEQERQGGETYEHGTVESFGRSHVSLKRARKDLSYDPCPQAHQYTDGQHAYWTINGKHKLYLNGQQPGGEGTPRKPGGEGIPLKLPSTKGGNNKYALELLLFRKTTVKGIILGRKNKIGSARLELKMKENDDWRSITDDNGVAKVFRVLNQTIEFVKPHRIVSVRIYPLETSGIIHFKMPAIIECLSSDWNHTN